MRLQLGVIQTFQLVRPDDLLDLRGQSFADRGYAQGFFLGLHLSSLLPQR